MHINATFCSREDIGHGLRTAYIKHQVYLQLRSRGTTKYLYEKSGSVFYFG